MNSKAWSFTPRMKAYSYLLGILFLILSAMVFTRKDITATVARSRGTLYQEIGDTAYSNLFNAKIINKTNKDIPIKLSVDGVQGHIRLIGGDNIVLKNESINEITFFVDIPKNSLKKRKVDIKVNLYDKSSNKKILSSKTNFLGPFI